jgi:hypothetical protein
LHELNFDIHSLKLKFFTTDRTVANFVEESLGYFLSKRSLGKVSQINFFSFPFNKEKKIYSTWLKNSEQLAAAGTHLYSKNRELIIYNFNNFCGLGARLELDRDKMFVEGVYCYGRKEFLRNLFFPQSIYSPKLLNSIKRLVIHYPLLFLLEQKNGIYFLHASAVEKEGKGFIFTGLPGCGKTLAMSILLKEGFRFLSDNFLLWNRDHLFAFPELLRIRDKDEFKETHIFIPSSLKGFYKINPAFVSSMAVPKKIFLLRLGERNYLKKLQTHEGIGYILSMEHTMKEFQNYSYLNLYRLNNNECIPLVSTRIKYLKDFLGRMEIFVLSLKRGEKNNKEFLLKILGE